MVNVSASVDLPLRHKVQKFSSGTGSPGWSRKEGRKTVVCMYLHSQPTAYLLASCETLRYFTVAGSSCCCCSFGQGSSLLWTHTLRPFSNRPIALTQEGRSLVNDVGKCVHD